MSKEKSNGGSGMGGETLMMKESLRCLILVSVYIMIEKSCKCLLVTPVVFSSLFSSHFIYLCHIHLAFLFASAASRPQSGVALALLLATAL